MRTHAHLTLRLTTLTAVLLALGFVAGADRLGVGGSSVAEVSARHHGALGPAAYTYALGWAIAAALIVLCAASLRPSVRALVGLDLICATVLIAAVLTPAWVALYRHEHLVLALVVLLAIEAAAVTLYLLSYELVAEGQSRWWLVPASLLTATTSVATIVCAASLLEQQGRLDGRFGPAPGAVVAIVAMSFLSLAVAVRFRDFVFPATIAWALVGVGAATEDLRNRVAFTAYLCSGIIAVATVLVVLVVATELLAEETRRFELRPEGPRRWSAP